MNEITSKIDSLSKGTTRICADDVAAALAELSSLTIFYNTFSSARRLANLTVKPSKCVRIPCWSTCTPHVIEMVRDWLAKHIPDWVHFKIASRGKYLGFWLGTETARVQWLSAHSKWAERTRGIGCSIAPPAAAAHLYNSLAVPCLEYVGQLIPVSDQIWRQEGHAACKVLHLPPSSISPSIACRLHEVGLKSLRSPSATCLAALIRTASTTIPAWPSLWCRLVEVAEQH